MVDTDDEDDDDESTGQADKRKLLAKDYIGEKYDWQLTEFKGPELSPAARRQSATSAESPLFVPSADHLDIVHKLEDGQQPRFPEEEGIYIGHRPTVSQKNQNRLERR